MGLFASTAADFPRGEWLNTSEALSLRMLSGHVIVLDFWTYCCINCMHVLPELRELEDEFDGRPVAFIGIHSPKFENEAVAENVQSAIQRYEIRHPIYLDDRHAVWNIYGVHAWPTFVVIDTKGKIALRLSGENVADRLRMAISRCLADGETMGTLAKKSLFRLNDIVPEKTTLSYPGKIDVQGDELSISNSNHNRILVTKLLGNEATIIHDIGDGRSGFIDGDFADARFNRPQGIARQGDLLYIADTENHAIRLADLKKRTVRTIAGNGLQAPGIPTRERLNSPWDVVCVGTHLYIAMAGSHQIWRMDLNSHELEAFAGTSQEEIIDGAKGEATFAQPSGLSSEGDSLYVADSEVSAIRKIDIAKGEVESLIGKGVFIFGNKDGKFRDALLQHPLGVDYAGHKLYIADTYNHAIKEADLTIKMVRTVIGADPAKKVCLIDKGGMMSCPYLPLSEPNDVIHADDRLLIADTNNHLIRSFDLKKMTLVDIKIHL